MALPAIHDFTVGEKLTAAIMDGLSAVDAFMLTASSTGRPACHVTNSAVQSIGNAADTVLTFDTETFDPRGIHSTSSNTGRITPNEQGLWLFAGGPSWAGNATNERVCYVGKNGANPISGANLAAGNAAIRAFSVIAFASMNGSSDYVQLYVFQNSGGSLNTSLTYGNPWFGGIWICGL
ncbi:hypothetical protein FDG2_0716 [Candidatus Protofrankia californiensis]|uniref:Uncharacterized protein n=1 Tax=Candidatus Protofrankia californiensis TaxID=1839754 RepID=A0A1C3NU76_9ACTN|nr:hypothetical protein FDG2_0716 [Candidatus Protofrankia californiensis]